MSVRLFGCAALLLAFSPLVQAQTAEASDPSPVSTPEQRSFVEQGLVRLEVVRQTEQEQWSAIPLQVTYGRSRATLSPQQKAGIRLTNTSEGRVMVIVSINGINPYTGRKAYQGQSGLVIEPGASLLVDQGKTDRKSDWSPILPAAQDEGTIAVAVFHERRDYPLVLPNMEAPPFGPETFRVGADGLQRWVPPMNYPFRRIAEHPTALIHMDYRAAARAALTAAGRTVEAGLQSR